MRGISFMVLGLVLLMVVAGCARKVTSSSTSEVKDSTYVKETPRKFMIARPAIKVTETVQIECDSVTNKPIPTKLDSHSGGANVKVVIDGSGLLTAEGGCDSLRQVVELMDREIFHLRHEKKTETKVVPVYQIKGIDRFCRWFTGIAILVLMAFSFYKLNKLNPLP